MELGGVPQKIDEYFHLGPIFYVCSSARNWVSFMYKGIYEQGSKDAMKGFNYDPPSLLKICDLLCVAIGGLM